MPKSMIWNWTQITLKISMYINEINHILFKRFDSLFVYLTSYSSGTLPKKQIGIIIMTIPKTNIKIAPILI